MKIVIDANIIISMLLRQGIGLELLFSDSLQAYSPSYVVQETERNLDHIITKAGFDDQYILDFFELIIQNITIVDEKEFTHLHNNAEQVCPGKKDVLYFALCMHLAAPLWSNEKRLKNQENITVFSTHELLEHLKI